jgi:hypothetical protein
MSNQHTPEQGGGSTEHRDDRDALNDKGRKAGQQSNQGSTSDKTRPQSDGMGTGDKAKPRDDRSGGSSPQRGASK